MQKKINIKLIQVKALLSVSILMLLLFTASAEDAEVRVNAPEYVSDTFEVTIDIENVMSLDSGEFDLSFDPEVVNVMEVKTGNIDNIEIPEIPAYCPYQMCLTLLKEGWVMQLQIPSLPPGSTIL